MPNEFVARNGIIAQNNTFVTGSVTATAGFTGSLFGTASWAQNAISSSYILNAVSASYALSSSFAVSAAYAPGGASLSGGATNYAAIWASTTTLTTGSIFISQSNVGIGTLSPTNRLEVSGSTNVVNFRGSGSVATSSIFTVDGASGRLFSVNDSLSGSLFSVNTVAGLPVIEAFSDNTVRIGQYGQRALYVSQSRVGIGKESLLNAVLDVSGSAIVTGSMVVTNNQNNTTSITISNTTSGTASTSQLNAISDASSGIAAFGKYSTTSTVGKIINPRDAFVYNNTIAGDIAILNDHNSGSIKLAAGGSSTPHMFISASGRVGIGTTTPTSASLQINGNVFATSYTGSLFGTASFALNAAGAASFPFTGSAQITGSLGVTGSVTATSLIETSALRYKENIQSLETGDVIYKLRPVTFDWKSTKKPDVGFIAEEVNEVIPVLAEINENGETEGVKYSKLTAILTKALQVHEQILKDQQKEIDELRQEINVLKNK